MRRVLVFAVALALVGAARGDSALAPVVPLASLGPLAPSLTLWAWERSEDLRFLTSGGGASAFATASADRRSLGGGRSAPRVRVAFLDRTVRFDDGRLSVRYRQQPLLVSPDTPLVSVVRIETRGRAPGMSQADTTAALVVKALHAPRVTALQIDFDARRSDRPFYAALLKSVRASLPREIPLSITALASWCVDDPWIDARDVDEIVPMLFQMGPDARHVLTRLAEDGRWPVAACNGAAGLATDERHDRLPPARSVYVFNNRAWTPEDSSALNETTSNLQLPTPRQPRVLFAAIGNRFASLGSWKLSVGSWLRSLLPAVRACGPWREFPLFTSLREPDGPGYLRGNLGVVSSGYRTRYLVVAWRTFRGRPMDDAELAAADFTGNPEGASTPGDSLPWAELRRTVADPPGWPSQWTATPQHDFFLNCPANAFLTAAGTFRSRRETLGVDNPEFLAWVHAQDQVFANCDWEDAKTPVIPPALPATASDSARADRDYQIAAALFYAGQLAGAERAFTAIGRDAASPWRTLGPYLAARAMVREGTVGPRGGERDLAAFPRAVQALDAILADPSQQEMHESARDLERYVAVRWHPADALATAARSLATADTDTARVQQNLIDFDRLLTHATRDTTGYRSAPPDAAADDLIDWARTFSSADDNTHAIERWHATHADYWLMAALAATTPDASNAANLLADAAHVGHDSPAFPTIAYHWARLLFLGGNTDASRSLLDDALAANDLPPSTVNQFRSIRMQLARTLDDFLRDAPRTVTDDAVGRVAYDRDALDVLNERIPLSLMRRAARSGLVPKTEREALAASVFTRAVLFRDAALIRAVLPETRTQFPALARALAPLAAARDDKDLEDEAWLVLAFHPGLRPYMPPDSYRDADALTSLSDLRDNWWCSFTPAENAVRPYATQYLQGERRSAAMTGLYPSATDVPWPTFLSAVERQRAMTEWRRLAALDVAPTVLERHIIDWVERHPDDPRAAHALAQSVRIGHLGCGDDTTSPLSKKAFTLLHQRYPKSEWATRTPYWYK